MDERNLSMPLWERYPPLLIADTSPWERWLIYTGLAFAACVLLCGFLWWLITG